MRPGASEKSLRNGLIYRIGQLEEECTSHYLMVIVRFRFGHAPEVDAHFFLEPVLEEGTETGRQATAAFVQKKARMYWRSGRDF